jgi:nitroreductase
MDVLTTLRTTGATRAFTAEPVPRSTVHAILDDARFAPSGGNRQPWRVALVEDPSTRRRMAALMQPVWDDYVARSALGVTPFNVVDDVEPRRVEHATNTLLDELDSAPAVLAVAADLRGIALMDGDVGRVPMTGGASIYPFCWSVLLAAHGRGLGGVLTTFLSRAERDAAALLRLPPDHALVATIVLGVPTREVAKLRRRPVESFASIDTFDGAVLVP